MRNLFLFVFALIAATACSCEPTFVPYSSPDGLYSLHHPEGWLNEVPRTGQVLRDRESGVELHVHVSWGAQDQAVFENAYTTNLENDSVWRRTEWQGMNGTDRLRASGENLHTLTLFEVLVVHAPDRVLTFTASTIENPDALDVMERILDTVRVDPAQPAPETSLRPSSE